MPQPKPRWKWVQMLPRIERSQNNIPDVSIGQSIADLSCRYAFLNSITAGVYGSLLGFMSNHPSIPFVIADMATIAVYEP